MSLRTVRMTLWAVVVVVSAAVAGVAVGNLVAASPPALAGGSASAAVLRSGYRDAGGPFMMTDVDGRTVTQADLLGKPWAMFFGFRNCPDVCPTTLLDAHGWLEALGPDAAKLSVVFVTVDPERDTPADLKEYLGAFDPRIIGLSPGTPDALAAVAKEYAIRYEKVDLGDGNYTMNHTSDTLLFDRAGRFAGFIPFASPSVRADPAAAQRAQDAALAALRGLLA